MTQAAKDAELGGLIAYDGFTFGGPTATPPTYSLEGEPVYDEAGITVTHVRYRLVVSTMIYAEDSSQTAQQMTDLRQRLSRPGRKLVLSELGLGHTTVSAAGDHPDVAWGVKPQQVTLEPVGGVLAWQLLWRCEFHVTEPGRGGDGRWLAFNYGTTYETDRRGYATRTVAGYVEIANRRKSDGGRRASGSTRDVRRRLRVPVPSGFRRESNRWIETPDRRRVEFKIVDRELDGDPFPTGIIDGDVDFDFRDGSVRGETPAADIRGWLEAAPTAPRGTAVLRLLSLVRDAARRLTAVQPGGLVLPAELTVSQKLFTRRASVHARLLTSVSLPKLLSTGGLWQPVEGTSESRWRASVESLWSGDGAAGLHTGESGAAVVDLVDNPIGSATVGSVQSPGGQRTATAPPAVPSIRAAVTPAGSYLRFRSELTVHREENVSRHALSTAVKSASAASPGGVGPAYEVEVRREGLIRETHGEPLQSVVFEGIAVRVKFPPRVPVLVEVGGRRVVERSRTERRSIRGVAGGEPIHRVRFRVRYDVGGYLRTPDPMPTSLPSAE